MTKAVGTGGAYGSAGAEAVRAAGRLVLPAVAGRARPRARCRPAGSVAGDARRRHHDARARTPPRAGRALALASSRAPWRGCSSSAPPPSWTPTAGGAAATATWIAALVITVAGIVAVPELRWRRWRWEVREHEVDIRRGTLTETRTLVPMQRVQHVDTRRDPLEQALGLATVVFHTAAGENRIPALPVEEAGAVRERIAALARTADEL